MALKRGLSGVHRIRGGGSSGGGSRSALVILVFFCVFPPLVFFVGRGVYIDSSNDYSNDSVKQNLNWRERLAMQYIRSLFSKEVLNVITASTADLGPFLFLDWLHHNREIHMFLWQLSSNIGIQRCIQGWIKWKDMGSRCSLRSAV